MYAEKLTGLGPETSAAEIVNPVVTMTRWLLQNHPDATVKLAKDYPRSPASLSPERTCPVPERRAAHGSVSRLLL